MQHSAVFPLEISRWTIALSPDGLASEQEEEPVINVFNPGSYNCVRQSHKSASARCNSHLMLVNILFCMDGF